MTYKLINAGKHGKYIPTGDVIPFDDENRDYFAYKDWLAEGSIPSPAEVQVIFRRYTGKERFDIFTDGEQRAIAVTEMADVDVKLFYDLFTAEDFVTYADPRTVQELRLMEQRGLLTPERRAAVIAEMTR